MKSIVAATAALFALSGCMSTKVTDETLNIVTVCGAGYSSKLDVSLKGKITKELKEIGDISAGTTDELKAAFVTAGFSDANYKEYLGCIKEMAKK